MSASGERSFVHERISLNADKTMSAMVSCFGYIILRRDGANVAQWKRAGTACQPPSQRYSDK